MIRTGDNNSPKMTYFQNPGIVKMYVTHFLHKKVKTIFFAACKIYRRSWCKKKYQVKLQENSFKKSLRNHSKYSGL